MAKDKWRPCYKCEDSIVGCHSGCPDYKKYKELTTKKDNSGDTDYYAYKEYAYKTFRNGRKRK